MKTKTIIKAIQEGDVLGLNKLKPLDWDFDYEAFTKDYLNHDYYYAFGMYHEEQIIGTGNLFLKGKVAWLANIIISEKYRRKGLGFEMTKYLRDFAKAKACETQLLIATALGEPVYKKLGFESMTQYLCFDTERSYTYQAEDSIRKILDSDLEALSCLDQKVNNEDRSHLIRKFYKTGFASFNEENELLGFYLPDFARGLVLAVNEEVGIALLKLKHAEKGRRSLIPVENEAGIRFFKNNGFKEGQPCARMFYGKKNQWQPNMVFSYGGGYCG